MSAFFSNEHNRLLSTIESNSSLASNVSKIDSDISLVLNKITSLDSKLVLDSWTELGVKSIKNDIIPMFNKNIKTFKNNVEGFLSKCINEILNVLKPLLIDLKNNDSLYEKKVSEYNSHLNDKYFDFSGLKSEIDSLKDKCTSLVNKINDEIKLIKSLSSSITELEANSSSAIASLITGIKEGFIVPRTIYVGGGSSRRSNDEARVNTDNSSNDNSSKSKSNTSSEKKSSTGSKDTKSSTSKDKQSKGNSNDGYTGALPSTSKTTKWTTLGCTWTVCNTKISVSDYAKKALRLCQTVDTSKYGDLCMAFSEVHASNMYKGNNGDNCETAAHWGRSSDFTSWFNDSKTKTLEAIYYEIMNGRPVVVQVNGNKAGTSRHFVTVIGFKNGITDPSKLTEDDLLIIDSWDGKVERMDQSNSRFFTTGRACHKDYSGYYLRILKH